MELLVLRHGKSSWSDPSLDDYDRPLKKRGIRDATRMGQFIRENGLVPDAVISSTAERARHTTLLALEAMGLAQEQVRWSLNLYHAEPEQWLEVLSGVGPDISRIMIVGHNPGLEDLVTLLCAGQVPRPEDGKLIPTAALAHLEIKPPWSNIGAERARLIHITRPKWLDK